MADSVLLAAVAGVPEASYAVGVSGGADSVALLHLLHHHRPELHLHVVHLDHQTRGAESEGDAAFVDGLAGRWRLPCTIMRRDQIEPELAGLPTNRSARFRVIRFELYRRVVAAHTLHGVILAHHADDQAETVLHRLLRGARSPYVGGMMAETAVGGLRVWRPLLSVRGKVLREYLAAVGQVWREDASNASMDYFRNRLRVLLKENEELVGRLMEVHEAMRGVRAWVANVAPKLGESFRVSEVEDYPQMVAAEALRRWLVDRGSPVEELTGDVIGRLVEMVADAATPPRAEFPGGVRVKRRGGRVFAERA